jgi:hypothetical protein
MLPLEIILFSAIPNHTFSCKEVPSTKSPGGKSLQFRLHLLHSSSSQRVAPSSSSSHNDVGPTVSVHNVTELTNIKPKCGLLKCLLHLATAEPACSIPTQHMSISR